LTVMVLVFMNGVLPHRYYLVNWAASQDGQTGGRRLETQQGEPEPRLPWLLG
jgi:hypothetical protein